MFLNLLKVFILMYCMHTKVDQGPNCSEAH